MPTLDTQDPKLFALTLSVAIDEFRKRLENLAGYGTSPEVEPLPDPDAFAKAEERGLTESLDRIKILIRNPLVLDRLDGTPWSIDSLLAASITATVRSRDLISGLAWHGLWGKAVGSWHVESIDRLCHVIGAAALLKDLARQLKSE